MRKSFFASVATFQFWPFFSPFRGKDPMTHLYQVHGITKKVDHLSQDAMGGVEKRGEWKTSRMTPLPKRDFGPLSYGTFSTPPPPPPGVSALVLQKSTTEQTRSSFRGSKNFRESASSRFPSPHTFCTPPYHGPNLWISLLQQTGVYPYPLGAGTARPTLSRQKTLHA